MIHTIVFSRITIDKNRGEEREQPPITILPEKSVHGLIIKKPSQLIYDPRGQHRAYLTVDCDDYDIEEQRIVREAEKKSGTYYVYTRRDAVKGRKEAPCLTMIINSDKPKYAYRIEFPGTIQVIYTTGTPILGRSGKNGVRLWIESEAKPLPVPEKWYDSAYFNRCCGYRKQSLGVAGHA